MNRISKFVRLVTEKGEPVTDLSLGEPVRVIEERAWVRIETEAGHVGFVPADAVARVPDRPSSPATTSDPPTPMRVAELARATPRRVAIHEYPTAGTAFTMHRGQPLLAHVDFFPSLDMLGRLASDLGITVYVTHSFRQRDVAPHGTVVPPAKRSNHLVGHAIDVNLQVDGEHLNSTRLGPAQFGTLPKAAQLFLNEIRRDPTLRWGGDFVRPDPVHIDDNLYRRNVTAWEDKLRGVSGVA